MNKKFIKTLLCSVMIFLSVSFSYACTNIIVSKGATVDGSVLVSYAADSHALFGELYHHPAQIFSTGSFLKIYDWDTGKYMGEIPQIAKTYQTVGNMNEHQVTITETTYGGRLELMDPDAIMDYGSLIYVTLQRAKTAREAIQIIVELANKYGYASEGETFSIADKNEAWIMDLIGKGSKKIDGKNVNKGIVWVAARVPDGYISAHANMARIQNFKKNDPENWLYAPDVISFAKEMGYFKGEDKDFSFCDAYAPADFIGARACGARVWDIFKNLCDGQINGQDFTAYNDFALGHNLKHRLPLFVKATHKISVKEVADAMRSHFEGTILDMTQDIGAGGLNCPYRWRPMTFKVDGKEYVNERAIATQQTGFWIVCQSRAKFPDTIGGILWFGTDDAATSCLTPVYTSIIDSPECIREGNGDLITYSPTSMFWKTNKVTNFAYLYYSRVQPEVRAVADSFENAALKNVAITDAAAMKIYKKGSKHQIKKTRKYLTNFTNNSAQSLFNRWSSLETYLFVKYKDGNIMKQNADGSFKYNKYNRGTPEFPDQPGYNEKFYKAIVKDHGKVLEMK